MRTLVTSLLGACLMLLTGCAGLQRGFLFFPTHHAQGNGLEVWRANSRAIGYCRQVHDPGNVWLMLHGNGGQAADRAYALSCFSPDDSVFIVEYPGYGAREGQPSRASFDAAAREAYGLLRKNFPDTPVCVVGESIGSGPACMLGAEFPPPDKIALVVPFDRLTSVAGEHVPYLPVSWLLEAKWDNIESLSSYGGPVEIFAAKEDKVIPIEHAKKLAQSVPSARFHGIPGGHNDWSRDGHVAIRNP